jgi:hypothetical protein
MILLPAVLALSALRSGLRKRLRRMAVVVMIACLAAAPMPLTSGHDPLTSPAADAARHAALVAQEIAGHGHSHDDGEAHAQGAGHQHGHDPADHSHQVAFFADHAGGWGLPPPQRWPSMMAELPDPATGFAIERPPKQAMSL